MCLFTTKIFRCYHIGKVQFQIFFIDLKILLLFLDIEV